MIRGKPSGQFIQFYEQYCRNNKLKSKVHLLNNTHLKLNADRLGKDDWTPVIQALKLYGTDLHLIEIYSVYHINKSKPCSRSRNSNTCEPCILTEPLLKTLIDTIITIITNSDKLASINLKGFPISCYVELLAESIHIQRNIQHFALPYCKLTEENVKCLCKTISTHTGLHSINLTGCDIGSEGAQLISTLIRAQKLVRYGETWKQSLRYRLPQPDVVPGLRRLILNDNPKIGDEGFKVVAHELMDDLWIKAVDLQNCGLTEISSKIALDLVKKNPILMILDVRRNGISDKVLSNIMSELQKDVDNCDHTYEWINSTTSSSSVTVKTLPRCVQSAPNFRTNNTTSLSKVPYKQKSNDILGELERTKTLLHKVSSKLYEEKNKRETLERQQKEFKSQLERIRTYLLQQDKTNQTQVDSDSTSTVKEIEKQKQSRKNIPRRNLVNRRLNSAQVFVLVPTLPQNKHNNCNHL